jgi:cell division protein FtsB
MTFIQPNKNKSILNLIIGFLTVGLLAGVFSLVVFYNNAVTINHNIALAKTELDKISAENTSLNNTIISSLGSDQLSLSAKTNNLIEDKNPQYFTTNSQWPLASR